MDIGWNTELIEQLDWPWKHQLRPRLDGLTDAEYFREPVADCWSVRPREQSHAPIAATMGPRLPCCATSTGSRDDRDA